MDKMTDRFDNQWLIAGVIVIVNDYLCLKDVLNDCSSHKVGQVPDKQTDKLTDPLLVSPKQIAHVRTIKILTRIRGFLVIFLYLV